MHTLAHAPPHLGGDVRPRVTLTALRSYQGFPNYMIVNTDSGRPDICSQTCGSTWYCSAAYEAEWAAYLKAVYAYAAQIGIAVRVPHTAHTHTRCIH